MFLGFFYIQKIENQFCWNFFDTKMWNNIYQCFSDRLFGTDPVPFVMRKNFSATHIAKNSLVNVKNRFWKGIRDSDASSKSSLFRRLFVKPYTSIAFYKSGEPLVKRFIWKNGTLITKIRSFHWSRFFTFRYLMDVLFSDFSSCQSCGTFIKQKQFKLSLFDKRKGNHLCTKVFDTFGCQIPRPDFFVSLSWFFINSSAKRILEKFRNFFLCVVESDSHVTTSHKRNTTFCVKKSCKVFHDDNYKLLISCPQRLNSMERGSILRYAIV